MKGLKIKIAKILKENNIFKSEMQTTRIRGWHNYTSGFTYELENKWDKGNEIHYLTKIYNILCENGLADNLEMQGKRILLKQ